MNDENPLHPLLQKARRHAPFGDPPPFGFETRLRAALATGDRSVAEWFATFSLRFSAACLPAALALAAFLVFQHQYALPEGVGGLVSHWMEILPLDI